MDNNIKKIENLHVALWLLKDTSWCNEWIKMGIGIAFPTLILAIIIAWKTRKTIEDLIHNIAVCFWLSANVVWMTGEFFFNKEDWFDNNMRWLPSIFFFTGLAILVIFYSYNIIKNFKLKNNK